MATHINITGQHDITRIIHNPCYIMLTSYIDVGSDNPCYIMLTSYVDVGSHNPC
jgi:hypothetical protein